MPDNSIIRPLCKFGDVFVMYGISTDIEGRKDVLMHVGAEASTDPWVAKDDIASRLLTNKHQAIMIFEIDKATTLTEDEMGKMLEVVCRGMYRDIKKGCDLQGALDVSERHFAGIAAETIRESFEELRSDRKNKESRRRRAGNIGQSSSTVH